MKHKCLPVHFLALNEFQFTFCEKYKEYLEPGRLSRYCERASGCTNDERFDFRQGRKGLFLFFQASRPGLGATDPPTQQISGVRALLPTTRSHLSPKCTRGAVSLFRNTPLWRARGEHNSNFKDERNLLYIRNQPVPRSKHFVPWL